MSPDPLQSALGKGDDVEGDDLYTEVSPCWGALFNVVECTGSDADQICTLYTADANRRLLFGLANRAK